MIAGDISRLGLSLLKSPFLNKLALGAQDSIPSHRDLCRLWGLKFQDQAGPDELAPRARISSRPCCVQCLVFLLLLLLQYYFSNLKKEGSAYHKLHSIRCKWSQPCAATASKKIQPALDPRLAARIPWPSGIAAPLPMARDSNSRQAGAWFVLFKTSFMTSHCHRGS